MFLTNNSPNFCVLTLCIKFTFLTDRRLVRYGEKHRRHFRGVRGVCIPPLFGVGVLYPSLFTGCPKDDKENPSVITLDKSLFRL